MCLSLDKKQIFDYMSNFFSGVAGAFVIVFALGQQNQINYVWLFVSLIALFFVGLFAVSIFNSITKNSNHKTINRKSRS